MSAVNPPDSCATWAMIEARAVGSSIFSAFILLITAFLPLSEPIFAGLDSFASGALAFLVGVGVGSVVNTVGVGAAGWTSGFGGGASAGKVTGLDNKSAAFCWASFSLSVTLLFNTSAVATCSFCGVSLGASLGLISMPNNFDA